MKMHGMIGRGHARIIHRFRSGVLPLPLLGNTASIGPARDPAGKAIARIAPGLILTLTLAAIIIILAKGSPVPPVLIALPLGAAVAWSGRGARFEAGGAVASTTLLRLGVVLTGVNIDAGLIARLGWPSIALTVGALLGTLAIGVGLARLLRLNGQASILSAASVAICGASAALAVSSVLPRTKDSEQQTAQVVALVTLVGSAAMLLYPLLAARLGFNDVQTGIFLGATLHELAQAAGAGASVSPDVGAMAVTVKLVRVACLAPVGLVLALWLQSRRSSPAASSRIVLAPPFLVGFVLLALARNLGLTPGPVAHLLSYLAAACLVAAMVGLGLKLSPAKLFGGDPRLVVAIVVQSVVLLAMVLAVLLCAPALFGGGR